MAYGDNFWGSNYSANPDSSYAANAGRRNYDFGMNSIDRRNKRADADAQLALSNLNYQYPRTLNNIADQMASRGSYFSGMTNEKEGDAARTYTQNVGQVRRNLADVKAGGQDEATMLGNAYGDSQLNAMRQAYQAQMMQEMGLGY